MNLLDGFLDTAVRYPDRLAVAGPLGAMTYAELDRTTAGLARALAHLGVGRGDRVIVWEDKSPTAIAAMLAALRLGAAYVPADGATPPSRVAALAGDCGAAVVCSTRPPVPNLPTGAAWLDLSAQLLAPDGTIDTAVDTAPTELAYILYTSGSTGAPKGVCISHGNARAFVDWAVTMLAAGPNDRFANHAPLTFDLSVLDLYAAFAVGASVHLIPAELAYAPVQLAEFLHDQQITVWYSVPSVLTLMMRDGGMLDTPAPPSLRAVLFAGEPFPIGQVRDLRSWTGARLLNLYGPTETNVCTGHEVSADDLLRDRPVPIGQATCGDKVWAERPDGTVAERGEDGELIVEGPTVMLGYWGQEPQHGAYRTGDIVRVLDDGSFDYLGRRDQLLKVRGHRVELGEVEAALAAHPAVAEVVAAVRGTGIDGRLTAFVVAHPEQRLSVLEIKRHSAATLPRYMVPDEVYLVPSLPRTRTGKTDRAALLAAAPRAQAGIRTGSTRSTTT
ncbi:amino acid adenylation domain-containing protein [Nocardia sp. CS682]|uniref:amino acid adenylation domain-containing protein n=1 Tax=Nocardia sp. CS682 TaxID=1047172 RepID=UPI0002147082|nr:amino acid adenylation domain-containing protein [Nocardia sp. CS682]AEI59690.1 proline adenyltransferase [Nocardia sp. CS682]QBS39336.1 D-alanine--poly(phosphoribitol) ligase [Nocardia sp. CS682]